MPKIITGSILAFLVIIFTIQNVRVIELRLLYWTLTMIRIIVHVLDSLRGDDFRLAAARRF
jgi:uncharacterized integral membrane protein